MQYHARYKTRVGVRNQDKLSDFSRVMGKPSPLWKYYFLRLKSRLTGGFNRLLLQENIKEIQRSIGKLHVD